MSNNKTQDISIKGSTPATLFGIPVPWAITLLAALLMLIMNINANTFGVFFKPIAEEFDWSRGVVSGAFSIRCLVMAVLSMPVGYLADRYSPRTVILPCFILLGLSFMLTSTVNLLWQFYLYQGFVAGAALSGPFVCIVSTVARWHDQRRGLALGIASAGAGLSSIVFPPTAAWLIQTLGWRSSMELLGLLTLIVGLPAAYLFRDPGAKTERRGSPFEAWLLLPRYLKDRSFAGIITLFFLVFTAGNIVNNHLVNYVTDAGIPTLTAAAMMSAAGVTSTLSRIVMGNYSDRVGARADGAVCFGFITFSLLLLSFRVPWLMWVSVVCFGVGFGGTIPLISAMSAEFFGTRNLATTTGAIFIGATVGGALGPWMGGLIFDASGSYLLALMAAAIFSLAALVITLRLPSPSKHVDLASPQV